MSRASLWHFSTAFYRVPGVAEASIALQDESGVDVNVMLYLLYLAMHGRRVSADEMQAIDECAAAWSTAVVAPLRALRRRLKQPIGSFLPPVTARLREEVKRIELASERIEQDALERILELGSADAPGRLAIARANLAAYAARLAPLPPAPLAVILEAFAQYGPPAGASDG